MSLRLTGADIANALASPLLVDREIFKAYQGHPDGTPVGEPGGIEPSSTHLWIVFADGTKKRIDLIGPRG